MSKSSRRLILLGALIALALLVAFNFNRVTRGVTSLFGVSVDLGGGGRAELRAPARFKVNVYAEGLTNPRLMAAGSDGTLFVAEQEAGRISALPDRNRDGKADERVTVVDGLRGPNSLFIMSSKLIIGEHTGITEVTLGPDYKATDRKVLVPDLPIGSVHRTKTAVIGKDGRLYVAMGSTCNVCNEADARHAAVWVYDRDGGNGRLYAKGLRNAVGLAINPWTDEIWATNNGRDLIGDSEPPETLYQLRDGGDYGWPRCHGGDLPDPEFGNTGGGCAGVEQPLLEMPAHVAPLGLAFYREGSFPAPYNNSVYIALHGSWNSSKKVGYKVVRVPLRDGKVAGQVEDFLTGFLSDDDEVPGRPAGVAVGMDGSLLVSDDKSGFIYRVSPSP